MKKRRDETLEEYHARVAREVLSYARHSPWEFRAIVEQFDAWTKEQVQERGVPRAAYAALLAEWWNAKEDRVRKADFLADCEAAGWTWETRRRRGSWGKEGAVQSAIRKAQRMERQDPEFAAEVAQHRQVLRTLRGN